MSREVFLSESSNKKFDSFILDHFRLLDPYPFAEDSMDGVMMSSEIDCFVEIGCVTVSFLEPLSPGFLP